MIATLVSSEYLSTTATSTLFDAPYTYIAFAIALIALIYAVFLFVDDDVTGIFAVTIVIMSAAIPFGINSIEDESQNKANLVKNVETAYDLDTISLGDKRGDLREAVVIKGGKSYEVLIAQNYETFEPSLASSGDNYIGMDEFKREK